MRIRIPRPRLTPRLGSVRLRKPRISGWSTLRAAPPAVLPEPEGTSKNLFWRALDAIDRADQSVWRAVWQHYYPGEEPPSPEAFIDSTIRAQLTAAGLSPESGWVKWPGRIGGFVVGGLFRPSMYLGVGEASKAAKGARVAVQGVSRLRRAATAPFRVAGKAFSATLAPQRLFKRAVTRKAENVLLRRGGRIAGFLAKPRSFARGVTAPFRATSRAVVRLSKRPGRLGALAASVVSHGRQVRSMFKLHPQVLPHLREQNYLAEGMSYLARATENLATGKGIDGLERFAHFQPSWHEGGYLRRVLNRLGRKRAQKAVREIGRALGADVDTVLMRIAEAKGAGAQRILRTLPVSGDAKAILQGLSQETRTLETHLLRLKQKTAVRQAFLPANRAQSIKEAFAKSGRKYITERQTKLPAEIPRALASPRIGYFPHVYLQDARKVMYEKGLWDKWAHNLRLMLLKDRRLSPEQIRQIIGETLDEIKRRRFALGEWARLPVARHMTVEELNRAAWAAGLPKNMRLVETGVAPAIATKLLTGFRKVAFANATEDILKIARGLPEVQEAFQKYSQYLSPQNITRFSAPLRAGVHNVRKGLGPLEGLILLKSPSQDVWIPVSQDLALAVVQANELFNPKNIDGLSKALIGAYDKTTGVFKNLALNYAPGRVVRDMIDDTVRMGVMWGARQVSKALSLVSGMGEKGKITLHFADGPRTFTAAALDNLAAQQGKIGGLYRTTAEVRAGTRPARGVWGAVKRGLGDVASYLENWRGRVGMTAGLLEHADLPFDEAVKRAGDELRTSMFAYKEITPWERKYPGRLAFFYRFNRHNIAGQLKLLLQRPLYQYLAVTAPKRLAGIHDKEAEKYMPEWIRARGGFPIAKRGENVWYTPGFGLSQFQVLGQLSPDSAFREFMGALAPLPRTVAEAASGKEFFLDRDLASARRLYSPAIAKAIQVADPVLRLFAKDGVIHEATGKDGKKYWVVPGWTMWLLSQFRPLNDLRKFLDPRSPLKDRVKWIASGQKTYLVNTEAAKYRLIRKQIMRAIASLQRAGVLGKIELPFLRKEVKVPAKERVKVRALLEASRALHSTKRRGRLLRR